VHVRLSEYPQARARYEAALPIYREIGARLGEANVYTGLGEADLAEENFASARERFERAQRIYHDIGSRLGQTYVAPRLAGALLSLGEIEKAVQELERGAELARTIEGRPNLLTILWPLAQIREAQKDFSAALGGYDELLSLSPNTPEILRRHAYALFELKDYARALADYQRLLELNPDDGWAHNGVGTVREKQGDLEGAVAAYSQAIAANPDEAAFVRNRASALIALNRLDEAHADCETASRLAADYSYTHARWGDLHLARGEWAEAEARYRAALAKASDEEKPGWQFDLAVALWGLGRVDEGWAEFEAALTKADAEMRAATLRAYRRHLERHPSLPGLAEATERLTPP
jgi:tetratricopeptide (TPR) repeat protein